MQTPPKQKQVDLFDDIFDKLEEIRKRLPNGELISIKNSVAEIQEEQKNINTKVSDLSKRLLDPETGVVVKVNKNADSITDHVLDTAKLDDEIPFLKNKVKNIEEWQSGINKALWIVFGSIAGLAITMFMQYVAKFNPNPAAVQSAVEHIGNAASIVVQK